MPRIFVAIPVHDKVRAAISALPRHGTPLWRWVAKHQYHITLKFLGEISETDVAEVRSAVEEAAARHRRGIHLIAKDIGAFPNVSRARIVWVGVGGEVNVLRSVQADIEEQLADRGFNRDERPFVPHITIARSRSHHPLPPSLQAYAEHDFGRWRADIIEIVESQLTASGPRYIIHHEIPLGTYGATGSGID